MAKLVPVLLWSGLIGAALIAGAFFAFSAFVMKALSRVEPPTGLASMQAINVVVINPLFLGVFVGTAIASLLAVIGGGLNWSRPGAAWLVAAGVLYLIGTFGVTAAFSVPLNDALAKVGATDADAVTRWANYVTRWTLWNHVRTIAATLSVVAYAVALRRW